MGGYATQSRSDAPGQQWTARNLTTGTVTTFPLYLHTTRVQETYSYRSGLQGKAEEDAEIQALRYLSKHPLAPRNFVPAHDSGHEFWTRDCRLLSSTRPRLLPVLSTNSQYTGSTIARLHGSSTELETMNELKRLTPRLTSSQISSYGSRAISSTAPTAPNASLSTFIGEFTNDGLPSLIGNALRAKGLSPKQFADEYLNVQFGWIPFLTDMKALLQAVKTSSQTIQQMQRDSGRAIRRKFWFPVESSFVEEDRTSYWNRSSNRRNLYRIPGISLVHDSVIQQTAVSTDVWFSGAFTYGLPVGDDLLSRFARYEALANKVLGTRMNASTLWELTPFSWLADWYGDIGNILSAASLLSEDGLILRYGYLMRKTNATVTVRATSHSAVNGLGDRELSTTTLYSSILKERVRATPFGFGTLTSSITARQWSILGALGLTRAPRTLW